MPPAKGFDLNVRGLSFGLLGVVILLLASGRGSVRWTSWVAAGILVLLYGFLIWRRRTGQVVNVSMAFVIAPIIAVVVVIVAMEAAGGGHLIDTLIALGVPLTALGLALWAQHSRRRRLES